MKRRRSPNSIMSSAYARQQGMLALPVETLDTIISHLSVVEKVSLASSCRTLWRHSSHSNSWWQSLALQPLSDNAAEDMAAWIRQRGSLVHQLQLSLDKLCRAAAQAFLLALTASQLPALQSLELRCAPPAGKEETWRSSRYPGFYDCDFEDPDDFDEEDYFDKGIPLFLPPAFSGLISLTSLSASGFSCLRCSPACLPAGLHSLTINLCPPDQRDFETAASITVSSLAQAAGQVPALQSLSIVVSEPSAHQESPYADDEVFLDLAALRDPWARQLTQLSLLGRGRTMELEHLAGLTSLQQLRLGAKSLHREWAVAMEGWEGWDWEPEPEEPPQFLAPLGALTQLRSIRLDGMDLQEVERLQPVWSLPLLQELDVANLDGLRRVQSSHHTLVGCKAWHVVFCYEHAAWLGPMLGPLEQVELLTITVTQSIYGSSGGPPHYSPFVLREVAAHFPGLRKVELVQWDGSRAPSPGQWQALSAVLPVGVELVLRMAGLAFFYPMACDRNA